MHYAKLSFNTARLGNGAIKKISIAGGLIFLLGCGGEPSSRSSDPNKTAVYEVTGKGTVKSPDGSLLPISKATEKAKSDAQAEKPIVIRPGKDAKISDVKDAQKAFRDSGVKYGS